MMLEASELHTDVLIVGSGAAGVMAAIKAAAQGVGVLLVTKGPYPSGNSSIAMGGYGVSLGHADPRDNAQVYFEDIVRAGQGLCNEKIVRAWTGKIIELTQEMDEWGIDLIKENGKFSQLLWPGHSYPRMVHHYRSTGDAVMKCLAAQSKKMGIKALAHTIVGGLFRNDEAVVGAWGFQYQTGTPVFISVKKVIWATGGMGRLFPFADNVKMATGEGYSLAFKIGAEVIGMEFCHFLKTIGYPEQMRTSSVITRLINTLIEKGGARYHNHLGQRFMRRYFPEEGDANNDNEAVVRAISREIYEGRGSLHGGVYLDVSEVPEGLWKKEGAPLWEKATRAQIDLRRQPLEIVTYPHDMIGGIKIDESGRTAVSGLYAAGEAAGGAHGAARIGGSALSEAIAFGAICGENAAKSVVHLTRQPEISQIHKRDAIGHLQDLMNRKSKLSPAEVKIQVQRIANQYLNVARDEAGLNKALTELKRIEDDALPRMSVGNGEEKRRHSQLAEALEVEGQVELAKIIAWAALVRKESRRGYYGGHYRIDYPEQNDKEWLKNVVLKREQDGSISYSFEDPVKV